MAIPLPPISGPRAVVADLKAFFGTKRKSNLVFAALSVAIPAYFVFAFTISGKEKQYQPPEVTFVKNWPAGRTIAEIRAQQKIDQQTKKLQDAAMEARRQKRMAEYRELEKQLDALGL